MHYQLLTLFLLIHTVRKKKIIKISSVRKLLLHHKKCSTFEQFAQIAKYIKLLYYKNIIL